MKLQLLFKTLFGSKLYGTSTPSSDTDIKYVVLPALSSMLCGNQLRNKSENTSNDKVKNTGDDVDKEYIPIQIFAKDFLAGQTYALEIAFSAMRQTIECEQETYDEDFLEFTEELVNRFLTSNVKAMTGYALNQAHIYGIKGSRLAIVELFCAELEKRINDGVSLESKFLLNDWAEWVEANANKYLFMTTYRNHDDDLPALSLIEKIYPFNISYHEALDRTKTLLSKYGNRAQSAKSAQGVDWKALSHAVRITIEACELLEKGKLSFPFEKSVAAHLLDIKVGNVPYADVESELVTLLDRLDRAKSTTKLPENSGEMQQYFTEWLERWMLYFYKG